MAAHPLPMSAVVNARALARPAFLVAGLAVAVLTRAAVNGPGSEAAFAAGAAFGMALLALAAGGGWRPAGLRPRAVLAAILAGGVVGAVLVAVPQALGQWPGARLLGNPGPLAAWVAVTLLVATAEEVLFRAALMDAIRPAAGPVAAVAAASAAFALAHVPLYGWQVVPLDLAVGVVLGGLRLATGSVAAPAVAHAVADLATWWA